jgi:hypothetical protein
MPDMPDPKKAEEWNKLQADLLRSVADLVERGDYYTLGVNNESTYALHGVEAKPRRLHIQVEYWDREMKRG